MRYNREATGPIDRKQFARSYARKIMRDHIDGNNSKFLKPYFRLQMQSCRYGDIKARELYVTDGMGGITLGAYQSRLVLQRHRFRIWCCPDAITNFFSLSFDDYLALYEIEDEVDAILARVRWG